MTRHWWKRLPVIALTINSVMPLFAHSADDNLLAYQLFRRGEHARAAEIFTDPAWKGIALYRSSQWWRAAEAFLRANDAVSAYNLGNCYVKLGYYALALDAYQQALALDPSLDDAQQNADIMRAVLASEDDNPEREGRQASGEEIEQIESDSQPDTGSNSGDGEQAEAQGDNAAGESTDDGTQSLGTEKKASPGKGGETSEDNQRPDNTEGESGGTIDGKNSEDPQDTGRPSGGSDTDETSADSAAAGMRTSLETEQATTQWLNRIEHDSQLFLQRRLKLEQRRRRAAGQSPPEGGSTW